jgi:hypothetical protein
VQRRFLALRFPVVRKWDHRCVSMLWKARVYSICASYSRSFISIPTTLANRRSINYPLRLAYSLSSRQIDLMKPRPTVRRL